MPQKSDWLTNFDITIHDLQHLEEWMELECRGVTLEEITHHIIRDRILLGQDESPAALPDWVQGLQVLSWDEEEKWEVGSRVFVLHTVWNKQGTQRDIAPSFGVIKSATSDTFEIERDSGGIDKYGRVKQGSPDAEKRFAELKRVVWQKEQQSKMPTNLESIEEQTESIFLQHGARIASRIISTLDHDKRFTLWEKRWYLQKKIPPIPVVSLRRIHRELLESQKAVSFPEMQKMVQDIPQDEFGQLSLAQALASESALFRATGDGWRAIKPPPPPWQKAAGIYYVYDPATYRILLQPGQRLKKDQAERLEALGWYADVVQPAE